MSQVIISALVETVLILLYKPENCSREIISLKFEHPSRILKEALFSCCDISI